MITTGIWRLNGLFFSFSRSWRKKASPCILGICQSSKMQEILLLKKSKPRSYSASFLIASSPFPAVTI
jgi:hypothetical protein